MPRLVILKYFTASTYSPQHPVLTRNLHSHVGDGPGLTPTFHCCFHASFDLDVFRHQNP